MSELSYYSPEDQYNDLKAEHEAAQQALRADPQDPALRLDEIAKRAYASRALKLLGGLPVEASGASENGHIANLISLNQRTPGSNNVN